MEETHEEEAHAQSSYETRRAEPIHAKATDSKCLARPPANDRHWVCCDPDLSKHQMCLNPFISKALPWLALSHREGKLYSIHTYRPFDDEFDEHAPRYKDFYAWYASHTASRPEASWRRMLFSQPPPAELLTETYCHWHHYGPEGDLGMTLGTFEDCAVRFERAVDQVHGLDSMRLVGARFSKRDGWWSSTKVSAAHLLDAIQVSAAHMLDAIQEVTN